MRLQVLLLSLVLHFSNGFPAKLLRMPKIYNALISTNQRLLPSEAVAASTGPVFQPIGLSGDPVLLNPEAFAEPEQPEQPGEAPRPFSKQRPQPITFYPRYNIYHQLPQSLYPYSEVFQPPPIVVPAQRSQPTAQPQPTEDRTSEQPENPTERPNIVMFVMNNTPSNSAIPNVPPPPPPVGAAAPSSSPTMEQS